MKSDFLFLRKSFKFDPFLFSIRRNKRFSADVVRFFDFVALGNGFYFLLEKENAYEKDFDNGI